MSNGVPENAGISHTENKSPCRVFYLHLYYEDRAFRKEI